MQDLLEAIESSADAEKLAAMPLPSHYKAACVLRDDVSAFSGMQSKAKDPRVSLRTQMVPVPNLAPDEVLLAVMASSVNYNTVWSALFEPVPTFDFLERLGREEGWAARHDLPYHIVGSDASGVVLRMGAAVQHWRPGDRVVVHSTQVDSQDPITHTDAMLSPSVRMWGYETNFGGMAELAVVKASQLLPKPTHLTWEESASLGVGGFTSYRMLVSRNGADMKQGDVVLIWGATGGMGGFAVQLVLNGVGIPVGVVSSPGKADLLRRMGCDAVIDRSKSGYRFWSDKDTPDEREWRRLGHDIRALVGQDPDIVFEHPGRETMGASVFVVKRGGTVVTCAATSGYSVNYDNRHLWMKLKSIKGSHHANYLEAWEANRLVCKGRLLPILSDVFSLDDAGEAALRVHRNEHVGKLGVLCLAPGEGLGVEDHGLRERVGEEVISRFRGHRE